MGCAACSSDCCSRFLLLIHSAALRQPTLPTALPICHPPSGTCVLLDKAKCVRTARMSKNMNRLRRLTTERLTSKSKQPKCELASVPEVASVEWKHQLTLHISASSRVATCTGASPVSPSPIISSEFKMVLKGIATCRGFQCF